MPEHHAGYNGGSHANKTERTSESPLSITTTRQLELHVKQKSSTAASRRRGQGGPKKRARGHMAHMEGALDHLFPRPPLEKGEDTAPKVRESERVCLLNDWVR